jgi:hypothetical protein
MRHVLLGSLILLVAFFVVAGGTLLTGAELTAFYRASVPTVEVGSP